METSLEGKVSIITGAATGIGRATAELFASEGAAVVVVDRNDVEGERTVASINDRGGDAVYLETDVSKADDVQQMVESTVERFGPPDILVNNAGIFIRMVHRVHEITDMEWDLTMQTNLKGAFYCCKYVLPHMMEKGGSGRVDIIRIRSRRRGHGQSIRHQQSRSDQPGTGGRGRVCRVRDTFECRPPRTHRHTAGQRVDGQCGTI